MIPTLASGIAVAIAIYSIVMKDKIKEKDSLGKNLLRIYLYIISFFSLILASASIAVILNASFASKFGVQFSYSIREPYEQYSEKEQDSNDTEKKCFSTGEEIIIDGKNYCIEKDAVRKDMIGGVSIAIPMIIIFVVHTVGIIAVERKYVVMWIKKGYRFISLIFFSIVGLISTSIAINKLVQFFILKPEDITEISTPGIPLSIALVVLPLWIYFLISTNKIKEEKEV